MFCGCNKSSLGNKYSVQVQVTSTTTLLGDISSVVCFSLYVVGWKPICIDFLGREKNNLSGISPAKRSRSELNSVHVDKKKGDNVQGILGAIGPFLPKWGLGRVPRSPSFLFGKPRHLSGTSQRPIFT